MTGADEPSMIGSLLITLSVIALHNIDNNDINSEFIYHIYVIMFSVSHSHLTSTDTLTLTSCRYIIHLKSRPFTVRRLVFKHHHL